MSDGSTNMVRIGFGTYNFKSLSGRLSVSVVTAPFIRKLAGQGAVPRHGTPTRYIAGEYPEVNGALYSQLLLPPDGTILMVKYSKIVNGRPSADGAMFVRTREGAGRVVISANIMASPESLLGETFVQFQGRGDVLSYGELIRLGIDVPKNFRFNNMDEEELAECFTITHEDSPRKAALDIIEMETASGEKKVIVTEKPQRRMRVRRT